MKYCITFQKDCEISDGHGNSHKVVDGNCLDSNASVQRESPYESTIALDRNRFSYMAFIFADSLDTDSAALTIVCNIAACLDNECVDIVNDCQTDRRRRDVEPRIQTYRVTSKGRVNGV